MIPEEEAEQAALQADLEAAGVSSRDFDFFARDIPEAGIHAPRFDFEAAAPILVRWLPRARMRLVKERIVRSLTGVKAATPSALRALVAEFRKASDEEDALKWAIANRSPPSQTARSSTISSSSRGTRARVARGRC